MEDEDFTVNNNNYNNYNNNYNNNYGGIYGQENGQNNGQNGGVNGGINYNSNSNGNGGVNCKKNGGVLYMSQIECVLTKALSVTYMKKLHTSTITPISFPVRDHSSGLPPSTVIPSYLVPTPGKSN